MHQHRIEAWQHDHVFGQDEKQPGESRTLIVVGLTLTMMVWEILAGIVYGSMALLADGLHMGSHAVALGIAVLLTAMHGATRAIKFLFRHRQGECAGRLYRRNSPGRICPLYDHREH